MRVPSRVVMVLIAIAPVCLDAADVSAVAAVPAEAGEPIVDAAAMPKAPLRTLRREVTALVTVTFGNMSSSFMAFLCGAPALLLKESSPRIGSRSCIWLLSLECDGGSSTDGCRRHVPISAHPMKRSLLTFLLAEPVAATRSRRSVNPLYPAHSGQVAKFRSGGAGEAGLL